MSGRRFSADWVLTRTRRDAVEYGLVLLFCVLHPRQSLLFMSLHKMESTLLIHSCSYTGHRAVVCDVSDLASVASPSSGLLHPSSQSASALRLKDTNIRNTQHSPKGAVKWTSALQSSFDITPSRPLQVKGLQSCIDTSFCDAVDCRHTFLRARPISLRVPRIIIHGRRFLRLERHNQTNDRYTCIFDYTLPRESIEVDNPQSRKHWIR
jgi:hypothetical protein